MIIFPRVYNNYNFFGITEKNVISRFFECYFLMCDVGSEVTISQCLEKGGEVGKKRGLL